MELSDDEKLIVRDLHLLTLKPVLYAANLSEDGVAEADSNPYVQQVRDFAVAENAIVVPISAKVEAEIAELEGEDKAMFLEELGLEESGLNRLIKALQSSGIVHLLYGRRAGSTCLDDPQRNEGSASGRRDSYRLRTRLHSCRGCSLR